MFGKYSIKGWWLRKLQAECEGGFYLEYLGLFPDTVNNEECISEILAAVYFSKCNDGVLIVIVGWKEALSKGKVELGQIIFTLPACFVFFFFSWSRAETVSLPSVICKAAVVYLLWRRLPVSGTWVLFAVQPHRSKGSELLLLGFRLKEKGVQSSSS